MSGDVTGVVLSVSSVDKGGLAVHFAGFFLPTGALAAAAANMLGNSASALFALALAFVGEGLFGFHERLAEKSFNKPLEYLLSVMAAVLLDHFFFPTDSSSSCKVVLYSSER